MFYMGLLVVVDVFKEFMHKLSGVSGENTRLTRDSSYKIVEEVLWMVESKSQRKPLNQGSGMFFCGNL